MSSESERMTRAEWERLTALEECERNGHDHLHIINFSGDLIRIVCDRCEKGWKVEPE